MWVVLDRSHNGHLVFVTKDKPVLLPYSKRKFPQSWNTLNGISQKQYAKGELNIFKDSDSRRFYSEPIVVKYKRNKKQQHDLILGTKP